MTSIFLLMIIYDYSLSDPIGISACMPFGIDVWNSLLKIQLFIAADRADRQS